MKGKHHPYVLSPMGHFPVGSQINLQDRRKGNDSPPSASVLISSTLINVSHPK